MRALGAAGVAVPPIIGIHPTKEAVLSERVPGATWFYRIKDPDEQVRVAQDFMRNLRLCTGSIPGTWASTRSGPSAPPGSTPWSGSRASGGGERRPTGRWTPAAAELRLAGTQRSRLRRPRRPGPGRHRSRQLHVPGRQGHRGGRLGAVALGRPNGQHRVGVAAHGAGHVHPPADRVAEYSALSGHPIDDKRVWYYRLFAESTMTTLYPNEGADSRRPGEADDDDVTRDIGNGLIYRQLHRRLWLEALGAVMGLDLEPPTYPEPTELPEWHRMYATVLGSLRTITPRISDPLANQWTKGVARVVKYLQDIDASGSLSRTWRGTRS